MVGPLSIHRVLLACLLGLLPLGSAYGQPNAPADAPASAEPASETFSEPPPRLDFGGGDELALGGWPRLGENLRLTFDLASRVSSRGLSDDPVLLQFIGLDLHKVFSISRKDWGTLILQGYLTRIDDADAPPPLFDDGDDWEFVTRIFNFNYTGSFEGRANLRVGHFEIPFGLEQTINTNGTLRDYTHGRNFGLKADWGVTVNGDLDHLEYEVAVSRGSGNEYSDRGNPGVVAARVGTPREENLVLGASAFYGDVAGRSGATTTRRRFGVDAQKYRGKWGVLGEVAVGRDESSEVVNLLTEIEWRNHSDSVLAYLQTRAFLEERSRSWDESLSSQLGLRYAPGTQWAFSLQLSQEWRNFGNTSRDATLSAQVRYRF